MWSHLDTGEGSKKYDFLWKSQMDGPIWKSKKLTKKTKNKICERMRQPIFLYRSECWSMRKQDEKRILAAKMSWLRRITGVTKLHQIRNDDIRQALGSQTNTSEDYNGLDTWKECLLTEFHTMHYMQDSKERETKADPDYNG